MRQIQSIRGTFQKFTLLNWLLIFGIVWFVVAIISWWQIVYTDPKHTFEGMLKNNFTTTGYTRTTDTDQQGLTANEKAQLQLGANTSMRTQTTLKQGTDTVVTDAISTVNKEFVRYTKIDTQSKDADGKPIDFSKAVNVWASSPTNGQSQSITQAMLGVFPMGSVPAEDRSEILKFMEENRVFSVNYDKVKTESVNDRKVYVYDVQLLPQPYIAMVKKYGQAAGLSGQVESLNPADYADAKPNDLKVKVDVAARRLVSVAYVGNEARTEKYSAYGIMKELKLPTKVISTQELQKRLSLQ